MKLPLLSGLLVASGLAVMSLSFALPQGGNEMEKMSEMMKAAEKFTKPGEKHKLLERFIGKWNTDTTYYMGGQTIPGGKGTSEATWMMPGRYLQMRGTGTMMGQPLELFALVGYDNFKQSYVTTAINSIDTIMLRFEGDTTPDGKALISYGTLDEYLTGEHDKMVKSVWRFIDADTLVHEVHDLPIGEVNTKVFDVKYTRAK